MANDPVLLESIEMSNDPALLETIEPDCATRCSSGKTKHSIAAAVMTGIAILLAIAATATHSWDDDGGSRMGLFKECGMNWSGYWTCHKNRAPWVKISQWFMILGTLLSFFSLICISPQIGTIKKKSLVAVSMALAFAATICTLVAYVVWANNYGDLSSFVPGYSFGMAVAASCFQCCAGIALGFSFRST